MIQSEQINELAAALVAAQGEFEAVSKTSDNPFFKSKYADLPSVVKAASPILKEHGLAVTQMLGADCLTTLLVHESGQFIGDEAIMHLPKTDPQGVGSATTYYRRYGYMAILGLVADVDDDGNAASSPQSPHPAGGERRPSPITPPNGERAAAHLSSDVDEEF